MEFKYYFFGCQNQIKENYVFSFKKNLLFVN